MTIEEAIKEIKDASDREVRYGDVKNHYYEIMMRVEAFVMAINVLEERLEIHDNCKKCIEFSNFEPQPCEDYISREEVMKCFKKWQPYMATRLWDYEQELKELPSVTPSYNSIKTELEPCDDWISRKRLLSRIDEERKHLLDIKMDGAEHIIVHHARRIIEDMPSVTPKAENEDSNDDT